MIALSLLFAALFMGGCALLAYGAARLEPWAGWTGAACVAASMYLFHVAPSFWS
jgi:hypothetical protein